MWNTTNGITNGNITYAIRQKSASDGYLDFELIASSESWNFLNIEILFRENENESWKKPKITCYNCKRVSGNRIFGIPCSKYGEISTIRWFYSENNLTSGKRQKIKVNILPSVRIYYEHNGGYGINEIAEENIFSNSVLTQKIYAISPSKKYVIMDNNGFRVIPSIAGNSEIVKSGLSSVSHIQCKDDGGFIVSDSAGIYEFDEVGNLTKTLSLSGIKYFEYCEETENVLVTVTDSNYVAEYSWDTTYGNLIWTSSLPLLLPDSATYNNLDKSKIVISDTGNDRIVLHNRSEGKTTYIQEISYYESNSSANIKIKSPKISFWNNMDVVIVEKTGKSIDFNSLALERGVGYDAVEVDFEVG